jgi:hypothetical protein
MNRGFTITFEQDRRDQFIAFSENLEEEAILTIYQPAEAEENYEIPAQTFTIQGNAELEKLYKLILAADKKSKLMNFGKMSWSGALTISPVGKDFLFVLCEKYSLKLIQTDRIKEGAYIPTKEISLENEGVIALYKALQFAFGIPIDMRFRFLAKEDESKQKVKSEAIKTGWEILK